MGSMRFFFMGRERKSIFLIQGIFCVSDFNGNELLQGKFLRGNKKPRPSPMLDIYIRASKMKHDAREPRSSLSREVKRRRRQDGAPLGRAREGSDGRELVKNDRHLSRARLSRSEL